MKQITILSIICLSIGLCQQSAAQKISEAEKERLYKTPAYWRQQNLARLQRLSAADQAAFNTKNTALRQRGYRITLGPTNISKLPLEQVTMKLTGVKLNQYPTAPRPPQPGVVQKPCLEILAQPTDPVVDMRDYGIVTQVHYQGNCGCCWDFATVAAFETSVLLQNGYQNGVDASNLAVSEQQVLNCTGSTAVVIPNTCSGGYQGSAAGYISGHAVASLTSFPYQYIWENNCPQAPPGSYRGNTWGAMWDAFNPVASNAALKQAICQHGSVISDIEATNDFGSFVSTNDDSVWTSNEGAAPGPVAIPNHVIQIIGWNDNIQAWLIKNSWGTDWGEGGFAWVKYGVLNIGTGAIWIDAQKTNNACSPGPGSDGTGHKLIGAVVDFDNASQGMESQDNYWLYLKLGHSGNNGIGNFVYQGQHNGYSQGQVVTNRLNLTQAVTLGQLQQQGCQLEIDRHGQFGGFHDNSDWNTGVKVVLVFDDGTQYPIVWPLQKMHCDNGKSHNTWIGHFAFTGRAFAVDPYKPGDPYSTSITQFQ